MVGRCLLLEDRLLRVAFCLLLLFTTSARAERQKIAVLEFDVAKGVDIDRIYFSDKVRGSIQDRAPQLFVMTRESTVQLLKASGKKLEDCAGECEVETGKLLGADYVVSGRITKVGRRFALTMRLHSTASGELLKTAEVLGKDADVLVEKVDGAVETLLGPLVAQTTTAEGARPKPRRRTSRTRRPRR